MLQGPIRQLLTLDLVSSNASMSACEKGEQWERAIRSVQQMMRKLLTLDVVS